MIKDIFLVMRDLVYLQCDDVSVKLIQVDGRVKLKKMALMHIHKPLLRVKVAILLTTIL